VPLLSPSQIHEVLKKELPARSANGDNPGVLARLLENSNLTPEEVLLNLSSLLRSGETDAVRLRAAETALRLNGLLEKDSAAQNFSVTINIHDSDYSINPILIPRG